MNGMEVNNHIERGTEKPFWMATGWLFKRSKKTGKKYHKSGTSEKSCGRV